MATAHSLFHQPSIWLLLLLAGTASCGSLAAWWVNDKGPSLIMQDDESGGIRYSLCNTNSTPIFPNDTTLVAPLDDYPPKKNTSLAGAGWFTGTDYFVSCESRISTGIFPWNGAGRDGCDRMRWRFRVLKRAAKLFGWGANKICSTKISEIIFADAIFMWGPCRHRYSTKTNKTGS